MQKDHGRKSLERPRGPTKGQGEADKQIREVLSDDQKKKLDQLEQGMHPELHGK